MHGQDLGGRRDPVASRPPVDRGQPSQMFWLSLSSAVNLKIWCCLPLGVHSRRNFWSRKSSSVGLSPADDGQDLGQRRALVGVRVVAGAGHEQHAAAGLVDAGLALAAAAADELDEVFRRCSPSLAMRSGRSRRR